MAARAVAYTALLPAINVGGSKKIAMPALRTCFEDAGCTDVATYIQSGNVVFRMAGSRKAAATAIEDAIAAGTGHAVPVIMRTGKELRAVIEGNPYPELEGPKLHVFFVDGKASTVVRDIDAEAFAPEAFTIATNEIYLALPNGMGRAKLPSKLLKPKPPAPVTARNWNTVRKLDEMVAELGG
jgi:uncharacterized protein (DUF1697 family)